MFYDGFVYTYIIYMYVKCFIGIIIDILILLYYDENIKMSFIILWWLNVIKNKSKHVGK